MKKLFLCVLSFFALAALPAYAADVKSCFDTTSGDAAVIVSTFEASTSETKKDVQTCGQEIANFLTAGTVTFSTDQVYALIVALIGNTPENSLTGIQLLASFASDKTVELFDYSKAVAPAEQLPEIAQILAGLNPEFASRILGGLEPAAGDQLFEEAAEQAPIDFFEGTQETSESQNNGSGVL